ncbi:hypothetical protein J1G44_07465 [Cellulomonas sp. zg-ZUI199]|uniref:Helicase XPB/Ssl2 N-terminal domain-containing protein n=1 Tax=Cellulomonas wangleii TaxID=2816956 RepID=A0ABX8D8E1_9CELL|nr:DUF6571 family protein [Cellulomonas wangleii]MBO0924322.1 hypothetical protein [Cellulomonas wangleii]QVI62327.1 hypothetical protein KG103_18310 [Cellulomonas wangleii]
MAEVRIDVAGMADVVRGLEEGIETVLRARDLLRTELDRLGLDSSGTWTLDGPVAWARGELPGVLRRLALAQALEGQEASWPAGTVMLDEALVSTTDPEHAQNVAHRVAHALREVDGPLDEDLIDLLESYRDDPYFASALARSLTVGELAEAVKQLSYARTGTSQDDAWYARTVVALARTMGTATRATGDLALPSGYAQQWVRQITSEVNRAVYPDAVAAPDHANALALLVTSGRWDSDFLVEVTGAVIDDERTRPDVEDMWLSRGNPLSNPTDGPGVYDAVGRKVRDPLSTLLAGLAKDPGAAQRVFVTGEQEMVQLGDGKLRVSSRLKHLVENRTWEFDRVPGRAFSQVLEAATMTLRDRESTGRTSAHLTTQTIALIGAHTGHDARGEVFLWPAEPGWQLPESLRPTVATMLATYGMDLYEAVAVEGSDLSDGAVLDRRAMNDGTSDLLYGPGQAYGAVFDQDLLAPVLKTLGEDRAHVDVVMAGLAVASNLRLTTALDQTLAIHPEAPVDLITGRRDIPRISNTLLRSSEALSWTVQQGYAGAQDDKELREARQAAFADALGLASSLPMIPDVSDNKNVQWLFDKAVGEAISGAGTIDASEQVKTYQVLDKEVPRTAVESVLNALLQSGYLEEPAFAAANVDAKAPLYTEPPDTAKVVGADPPRFDTSSEDYGAWVANLSNGALLQNTVIDPYGSAWGNIT